MTEAEQTLIEICGVKLSGLSLSGIRTAITLPELSMSFDVAQGQPYLHHLKKYFITHGHMDHAAGIPYIISQKALLSQAPAQFFMPESLVGPMQEIMNIWEKIEGHKYEYTFTAVKPDDEIELNHNNFIKVFPTVHRIPSQGYTLFFRNKKLKEIYRSHSQAQLIDAREKGEEIQDTSISPLVSFTGDTQIEFLNQRPWIMNSKILIIEATYIDDGKTAAQAKMWGHTHLDEIIQRLPEIKSEKIVLIHLSSRYSMKYAERILRERVPKAEQERFILFPGR
jgi:ribonuclease Z